MKTFSIKPQAGEQSVTVDCPVCQGDSFADSWDCGDFSYVRCNQCGLILQNPQPVFEALDDRYDEEYFQYERENDKIFFDLMVKGLEDVGFPESYRFESPQPAFLDIGCATGLLVEFMEKNGWQSKGVELCEPAARFGNEERGVDIFAGTVEQADYPSGSFDVVHCSHLIEHLNDPRSYVEEVYRILKPGGLFLCVTPNSDGLQARLFGSQWRSAIADHMVLFSRRTLARLLKDKSFHIVKTRTWGGLGKGYGPDIVKKVLDRSAKKLGFGDVMIICARK